MISNTSSNESVLLAQGKITEVIVASIRSWQHSGFSVDQSVGVEAEETEGIQRLIEYFLRCSLSQSRMIEVTVKGKRVSPRNMTDSLTEKDGSVSFMVDGQADLG